MTNSKWKQISEAIKERFAGEESKGSKFLKELLQNLNEKHSSWEEMEGEFMRMEMDIQSYKQQIQMVQKQRENLNNDQDDVSRCEEEAELNREEIKLHDDLTWVYKHASCMGEMLNSTLREINDLYELLENEIESMINNSTVDSKK